MLAKNTHFAKLIVNYAHLVTLHGGQELSQNQVIGKFWILHGRSFICFLLRKCVFCARFRARTAEQIMAALPEKRVIPQRPFLRTGLDYAGPFWVRSSSG